MNILNIFKRKEKPVHLPMNYLEAAELAASNMRKWNNGTGPNDSDVPLMDLYTKAICLKFFKNVNILNCVSTKSKIASSILKLSRVSGSEEDAVKFLSKSNTVQELEAFEVEMQSRIQALDEMARAEEAMEMYEHGLLSF